MAHRPIAFLLASAVVVLGAPVGAAFAREPMPSIADDAPVAPAPDDAARLGLRPFLTNAFDKRSVALDTGAPGGGTYVQRVPQAAGLTFKAAL